jgi:hypothetical protein
MWTTDVIGWSRSVTGRGVITVIDVGVAVRIFDLRSPCGRLVSAATTATSDHPESARSPGIRSSSHTPDEFGPVWNQFCTGSFTTVIDEVRPHRRCGAAVWTRAASSAGGAAPVTRDAPYPGSRHTQWRRRPAVHGPKLPPAAPVWL